VHRGRDPRRQLPGQGCLTDEPNGDDITQLPSQVDAVGVSASPTDDVTYIPGSSNMQTTPKGSVDVTLPLTSGSAVTIFRGALNKALSSQVTFAVPSGTMVAGIGISGTLTLTPGPWASDRLCHGHAPGRPGRRDGHVDVHHDDGRDSEQRGDHGAAGQLHAAVLAHEHDAGLQRARHLEGRRHRVHRRGHQHEILRLAGLRQQQAQSGSLTVSSIDLAGMVTISNLNVTTAAAIGQQRVHQAGLASATVAITLSGSKITSASVKTGALPLFGYVEVKSFDLEYNGTSWSLAVTSTLSGGATASAALSVSNGRDHLRLAGADQVRARQHRDDRVSHGVL